jgi:hypothetical protein
MSKQPRIPDAETRARSVYNLREVVKRMDRHIADLDELNARLEAENQKNLLAAYLKRKKYRLAVSEKEFES